MRPGRVRPSAVVIARRVEHVEDGAGGKGAGGMALMGRDVEHLARSQYVGNTGDRQLEGAAQQQGPLLVRVGVVRDDRAGSDVDSALGNMVRVEVAAEVAGSDLTGRDGGEVE
jgi:hypothetical protein